MSEWPDIAAARSSNRILAGLPDADWRRLAPKLEIVPLHLRQEIIKAGQPFHHVYFVLTGVGSLVSSLEDGSIIEVATVGNEGMVGLAAFLGANSLPLTAFVQVPGEAMRLSVPALHEEVRNG